ncbi:hypothetical protein [Agromyces sp. LHK192]|uniref:hypothetical protein n=1 Tax=Agromyces sp. LHK192 TaxID=2498704 RepID=UPI000FD7EA00|nr:hypothetical protein [Agromyces sp. LHK192]
MSESPKRVQLKRLATCTLGKMVQTTSSEGAVQAPYLRAAHVQPSGRLIDLPDQRMWFSNAELRSLTLRRDDVVIVEGGAGYGRSAVLHEDMDGWGFQNSIIRVRPTQSRADGRFLDYAIQAALDSGEIDSVVSTATIPHFTAEKVARLPIAELAVEEQRAIADYLDRETAQIDAFIAKNEELIALLTERRAAAIELAVAPAELPEAWDHCQVRRLGPKNNSGVSVNGYSVPAEGDEIGVLKTGAVSKGYFDPSENKRVVEEEVDRVATPVLGGTLIVNRANTPELVGSAGYVKRDHPTLYLSDKLWQLTFSGADAAYMHYWTLSDAYRSQLRGLSVGASSSMQNLSYGDFLSVLISVPSLPEQLAIVERLNRATAEIDAAIEVGRRGITLARERRAALISAAVTGKIDVGVAV